jgi:hypothetical protein
MGLNTVYSEAFISEVYRTYQKGTLLSNVIANPKKIVGNKAYFPKVGDSIAHRSNKGDNVMYINDDWEWVPCETEDYVAPHIVYDEDKDKFNYDTALTIAKNITDSLGRALDQIIIRNALTKTITPDIGGTTQKMTVSLLTKISEQFNNEGVPMENRYILYIPALLTQLLNDPKATSVDFASVKALIGGDIKEYMGFKFIAMEKRKEGGLPVNVTDKTVTAFAFHTGALGKAIVQSERAFIERDPTKDGWKHEGRFSIGATKILDEGIIPVTCNYDNSNLVDIQLETASALTGIDDALVSLNTTQAALLAFLESQ